MPTLKLEIFVIILSTNQPEIILRTARTTKKNKLPSPSELFYPFLPNVPISNLLKLPGRHGLTTFVWVIILLGVVLVSLLLTLNIFTPCSSVSVVNFEQVNACWALDGCRKNVIFKTMQLTFTRSRSNIETPEKGVKYVQS